jgi:nucleoid DNA-binding protein/cell division septation protein DedD
MEKYIKAFLLRHGKIQVRHFGSFEIVYKPATIHPILHTFTVPGRYVVFSANATIPHDELATFIISQENTTLLHATKRIEEWVHTIENTLAAKKEYPLDSMGKFCINAMGRIEFIPFLDPEISPDSFGLEAFTAKLACFAPNRETSLQNREHKQETTSLRPEKEERTNVCVPEKTIDETHENNIPPPEKTDEPENPNQDNDEELIDGFSEQQRKKHKPKRTLFVFILSVLLCCVVLIGVSCLFYPEVMKNYTEHLPWISAHGQQAVTDSSLSTTTTQGLNQDTTAAPQQAQTSPPENNTNIQTPTTKTINPNTSVAQPKQTISSAGGYYVVIGSFQSNQNAQDFLNKQRVQYPNAVNLGKEGTSNLYKIAIGPYTQQEAEALRNKEGKGWWIVKK